MNRWQCKGLLFFTIAFACGCQMQSGDENAIRASIKTHLSQRSDLNLGAMEYEVKQVSIDRDQATAHVEFHVKQGAGTMEVDYALARRDGTWIVLTSNPVNNQASQPATQQPSNGSQEGTQNSLPSFRDLVPNQMPPNGNPEQSGHYPGSENGASAQPNPEVKSPGNSY